MTTNTTNMSAILKFLLIIVFALCIADKDSIRRKLPFDAFIGRQNKSMVVSTLALRLFMCKMASAADSETKEELLLALGLDQSTKTKSCYAELKDTLSGLIEGDMIFLNKMYVNYTDGVDANFITNSSETFGVQVDKVGFEYPKYASAFINKWVDTASYKRITDIIEQDDIAKNSSILLLSAAYLKPTWEFPFDIRLTKNLRFHHFNQLSFIPMMTKVDSFLHFEDKTNKFQMINIKFGPPGTSITLIIPQDSSGLPNLLKKFSEEPNFLTGIQKKMKYNFLKVVLPRFKIKTNFDWTDLTCKFVSKKVFNTTHSGLNGMLNKDSKTKNVYLSKVKQKSFVDIDEMGVYRHIEGMEFQPRTAPGGPNAWGAPSVLADRPFLFTINLEPWPPGEQYELFHGVFYGPE